MLHPPCSASSSGSGGWVSSASTVALHPSTRNENAAAAVYFLIPTPSATGVPPRRRAGAAPDSVVAGTRRTRLVSRVDGGRAADSRLMSLDDAAGASGRSRAPSRVSSWNWRDRARLGCGTSLAVRPLMVARTVPLSALALSTLLLLAACAEPDEGVGKPSSSAAGGGSANHASPEPASSTGGAPASGSGGSTAAGGASGAGGSPAAGGGGSPPAPGGGGASFGASCAGQCGDSSADESCWCDETCEQAGDCCADFAQVCGGAAAGGAPGAGGAPSGGSGCTPSLCNTATPAADPQGLCFCDAECSDYGDCCANKLQVCGP